MKAAVGNQLLAAVVIATSTSSSTLFFGRRVGGIVVVEAFNSFFPAPFKTPTAIPPPPPSQIVSESWLDDALSYKKNGESIPSFDVLAKTIEYANCKDFDTLMAYYSDDYVFRGPIIGPITAQDVRKTQEVRARVI